MPVTTPVAEPMVAMPGDADVQVPPPVPSVSVVVAPGHTRIVPLTGTGMG
jgi:hypothetical protein